MLDMFTYSFMQRALVAGIAVAIVCPAIGVFLVMRRLAQYGDTLAHVSLVGVAAGVLTKVFPMATGLVFSVLASLGMDWLRQRYAKFSELSLAIMAPTSLALAMVLARSEVMSYLFGSVVTVDNEKLYLIGGLGLLVLAVLLLLYKELLSVSFDEEQARVGGVPVAFVNTVFMVLTAMTVAMAMSVVGVLLVSALIVVPVATALQIARSFRGTLTISVLTGVASVVVGLVVSYWLNLMPGVAVTLTAVAGLLLVLGYKRIAGIEE
ncbi:MAG: transporter permease protein [Symbiobacteriaceae bacterium]|jgi:zinc transport system permease protein|nr:transporter permease protein [Symbiobacteriaceae bacterium]